MESTRQKKVARLLQKEMAEIIRQKTAELAKGKMITVTTVRVSPDLGIAKIYLSVFPSDNSEEVLQSVTDNTPRLRSEFYLLFLGILLYLRMEQLFTKGDKE